MAQASVVTSTTNRTAPSALSTLVFLPIILEILSASFEAISKDASVVWRCHSMKGFSSWIRNCSPAIPQSPSITFSTTASFTLS